MAVNPILTYNNDGVLGTSDDARLVDDAGGLFGTAEPDAVLSWDSNVVCETNVFNGMGKKSHPFFSVCVSVAASETVHTRMCETHTSSACG